MINRLRSFKSMVLSAFVALGASGAFAETEMVNGYAWSYRIDNGGAMIISEKAGEFLCAVSPCPTGDVTIPSILGGKTVTSIGKYAFDSCSNLTSVTMPSSVTSIGSFAFVDCSGLTGMVIQDGVTSIGKHAFAGCSGLTSVTIPSSVTSIGDGAFYSCCGLTSVTIPSSLTRIMDYAFINCSGLTGVVIPNGVTSVGGWAFYGCSGLTSVTIPSSVTSIGTSAFHSCSGLTSMTIPNSVTNIGQSTFHSCSNLTSVTIPDSVTSIGNAAFYKCRGLTSVTMSGERPDAPNNIFQGCGKLKLIHVPANAKSWEGMKEWQGIPLVFDQQFGVKRVDFPAQEMNVAAKKLQTCDFLLNKDFKRNAKVYLCLFSASWCPPCRAEMPRIAKTYAETLKDDPNIELVHFSRDQDDEKALDWAKEHAVKFPVVKPKGGNPLNLLARGIPHLFIVKADGTLVEEGHPMKLFTDEKLHELKAMGLDKKREQPRGGLLRRRLSRNRREAEQQARDEESKTSDVKLPYKVVDGAVVLGSQNRLHSLMKRMRKTEDGKFAVVKLSSGALVIPNVIDGLPVRGIGNAMAFPCCSSLTSVEIPASVTNIDGYAFYSYSGRNAFNVAGGNPAYKSVSGLLLTKDGKTLVYGVNGNVAIPDGVKSIGLNAFRCCSGLMGVTIPDSVTVVGDYAFFGCNGLEDVSIGNGVTSIRSCAFSFCSGLARVTIGNSVTSIGGCAFSQCSGLASVTIPGSVTNIDRVAFLNCSGLNSFSVAEGNPSYKSVSGLIMTKDGKTLVHGVNGNVTIPDGVMNIGDDAFFACSMLESVAIPTSVKVIGNGAFKMCGGLQEVIIPEGVTSIGENAFRGLGKLTTVAIPASVTNIGGGVFSYCGGLREINVDAGNQKYVSINGVLYTKDLTELVMWPIGVKTVTIPGCVTNIGGGAFAGFKGLHSATIPDSVTSIRQKAFFDCSELTSITICGERPEVPNDTFQNCGKLKSIHVPANAKSWAGMKEWQGIPLVFDGEDI